MLAIVSINDLYVNGNFRSFVQLQSRYSLSKLHFFRYLQLRHCVQQVIKFYDPPSDNNALFKSLLGSPETKHLILNLVRNLDTSTVKIKPAWECELGVEIREDLWDEVLTGIKLCSVNARLQLIQCKVIHRLHYSKTKLHRIFPSLSPLCNRCNVMEGTLTHLFWTCPKLCNCWSLHFPVVFHCLSCHCNT